jgi:hypothetical protein
VFPFFFSVREEGLIQRPFCKSNFSRISFNSSFILAFTCEQKQFKEKDGGLFWVVVQNTPESRNFFLIKPVFLLETTASL